MSTVARHSAGPTVILPIGGIDGCASASAVIIVVSASSGAIAIATVVPAPARLDLGDFRLEFG